MLVDQFPDVLIDAIDISPEMIKHSREKFKRFPKVTWIPADAQTYRGKDPYPLIVSSAALHWTTDLPTTLKNVYECLESDGFFSLGMMLQGTLKELWDVRRELVPHKTPEPPLPSHDHLVDLVHAAGFHILRKQHSFEEVAYDNATAFLRAIHEQGVTGTKVIGAHAPLTRSELIRLTECYQERYTSFDGVYATYETATLLLKKV